MNKISASMAFALLFLASQSQLSAAPVAPSHSMEITDQNSQQQTLMPPQSTAPILYKFNGNHDRLFIAVFDCSWKNAKNGPTEPTTAQSLYDQLKAKEDKWHGQIHTEYVETDCAHDNWYSNRDSGKTIFDARVEQMYRRLGAQAQQWLKQDHEAQIRLLDFGGSWGALQAAVFSHVVDRRGIEISANIEQNGVASDRLLIGAGKTAQAVVLLDPVGTTADNAHLPPSVISGIQFTALDEHRSLFKSDRFMGSGITENGRFWGISVPGAHSDVCGGYIRNGLSIRTGNLVIDYINALSDHPLLQEQAEPTDPRLNVIHHSEDEGT